MSRPSLRSCFTRNRAEAGQIIVIVAFASIALFAMIGLAIDAGRLYVTRAELSRSVDAAVLSGILEFNGTSTGLTNGVNSAYGYFDENEGTGNVTRLAIADGANNEMTMDATKTVDLIFMRVLGIETASVKAHAKAGFGTQFLDAVLVLDTTPSMAGNPIQQAVLAATAFKNILLGNSPQGNVKVGITAFRGCFRPSPISVSDCVLTTGSSRWVENLSHSNSTLNSVLTNIGTASGGANAGTNVCTGLAMGWNIVSGAGNHNDDILYPENQQFLILLSDGDNYYSGNNTYQAPYYTSGSYNSSSSPTGTTVGGTVYPCQPIDASTGSVGSACPAPWNTPTISATYPCYKGVATAGTLASDNFDTNTTWTQGTGWTSGWVVVGSAGSLQDMASDTFPNSSFGSSWATTGDSNNVPAIETANSPYSATRHMYLRGTGTGTYTFSLSGATGGQVSFRAKKNSGFSSTDRVTIEARPGTSGGWTTVVQLAPGDLSTSYALEGPWTLPASFDNASTVQLRFTASMATADRVWIDDLLIQGTVAETPALETANSPQSGSRHLYLRSAGSVTRPFSMTGAGSSTLTFYAKRNSGFSSTDRVYVELSTNGTSWTELDALTSSDITTNYQQISLAIPSSFNGQSTVYLRFRSTMASADRVWIDTISIASTTNGFLNGVDGSSPSNCATEQTPRERQMDVRTLQLASAIKAQGIEVFVVAFAGGVANCYLNQNVIYDAANPNHCGLITTNSSYPIGASGPDGYTNSATTNPNVRLLQCIASSTPGTKDHYFYANTSSDLQDIFTQIATQIAHRLIE